MDVPLTLKFDHFYNFKDPIWATVADRDSELLNKKQIIMLQLCTEFNSLSTSEVIMKLTASNGFTVMVESPLYFHSIRPVLASLQKFDMEAFPLMPEIVRCQPSEHIPEYLSEDITLNASSIFADKSIGYGRGEFVEKQARKGFRHLSAI